ncbi:MAG: EamA family transporter [Bacteroidota bacterium]
MLWFILATCSAILSAASAILQKKILNILDALEFSFSVSLAIVILSLFIPWTTDISAIPPQALMIIIGKSILGASAFLLVMLSLKNNQISSALPLLGLTPAATALASLLIIGEGIHPAEWMGIGLMIVGVGMLDNRSGREIIQPFRSMFSSKKYFYVFGAVSLFAFSSIFDKVLVSGLRIAPLVVLFYQHLVYTILFLIVLLIRRVSPALIYQKAETQWPLIAVVAALTLAYRFTQLEATALAPVALVLAVKRTSILYASFFGGRIFSEDHLQRKLIGALLIVAAGFLIMRNVG